MQFMVILLTLGVIFCCKLSVDDPNQLLLSTLALGHSFTNASMISSEDQLNEFLDGVNLLVQKGTKISLSESAKKALVDIFDKITVKVPASFKKLSQRLVASRKGVLGSNKNKSPVFRDDPISLMYTNYVMTCSSTNIETDYVRDIKFVEAIQADDSCPVVTEFKKFLFKSIHNCHYYIPNYPAKAETLSAIEKGLKTYREKFSKKSEEVLCLYFLANLIDFKRNVHRVILSVDMIVKQNEAHNKRINASIEIMKQAVLQKIKTDSINTVELNPGWTTSNDPITNDAPTLLSIPTEQMFFIEYVVVECLATLGNARAQQHPVRQIISKEFHDSKWDRLCPAIKNRREA
jgi:hypothetical protein